MANSELIYDIIEALQDNLPWSQMYQGVTLSGGTTFVTVPLPEFIPITGYDDTVAPFILYSFISRMEDIERYYISVDNLRFYVYDNNIDRMWAVSRAIRNYLNVGDDIETLKGDIPSDSQFRVLNSALVSALSLPPIERDGFVCTVNEFKVKYVLL